MSLVAVVMAVVVVAFVAAISASTAGCTIFSSGAPLFVFALPSNPVKFGRTTATKNARIAATIRSSVSAKPPHHSDDAFAC